MSWFHAARARLRLLPRPAAESRIDDELRFHIEMETQRLVREQKLDEGEARRRALATFGGVQQHRETLREGRGTAWFSGLSLDLKLGGRMLLKYPGLTIVGGLAMAFGIWFGAVMFEMLGTLQHGELPLPDGDRIVKIVTWDTRENEEESRALHDFQLWRSSVRSITDLGAYRDVSANIVGADSTAQPAVAAEITSSAFRIAPDRPTHGRVLNANDERAGAPPVVVLGYELWRERFGGDPTIIGRSVRVGSGHATVVGVMPEGYAFPISHELWMPLRADVAGVAPRAGPFISVFGKLAPNATFESAQAELTSIGRRLAAEFPATHAQLQPRVRPYTQPQPPGPDEMSMTILMYFGVVLLLVVVCSTVALLLFARAASRESEILVRSALGATRRRIVTQLFAEALVLGAVAVVVALAAAQIALTNWGRTYLEVNYGRLPFWLEFNISPMTLLVASGLALLGAAIAGIIPARKITHGLGAKLKVGTGGGGGVKFGGVWTAVIVTQVAVTVLLPAAVLLVQTEIRRIESYDVGFAAERYLGVNVGIDGPPPGAEAADSATVDAMLVRFSGLLDAFRRRLESEPGVVGVTFVDALPRDYHSSRRVELASLGEKGTRGVSIAYIDPSYFDVLQAPPKSGRAFTAADLGPQSRVVVVDQRFGDVVMRGRNPVGQRLRIGTRSQFDSAATDIPTYDVVGVVKNLGMEPVAQTGFDPGVYFPMVPGRGGALEMIVQTRGDPLAIAPRVRELATAIDPTLRIGTIQALDKFADSFLWFLRLWMRLMIGLTGVALLLSLAGIYSVLAYTVARRTREIGVRVALGSSSRRIVTSIFRRPLTQVAIGVLAGSVLLGAATVGVRNTEQFAGLEKGGLSVGDISLLFAHATLMLAVCLLACVVPTWRALRVQPTEALRAE
jgi:putative ABC transport system permease protein